MDKSKAEKYIERNKNRIIPYEVEVMGIMFMMESIDVYPPGKLSNMFCKYLVSQNVYKDKVILDVGCGVFPLGIIGIKYGAKRVIGVDINPNAIKSAITNLKRQKDGDKGIVIKGSVASLFPKYQNKIDIIVSGIPWESIKKEDFNNMSEDKKLIARAFYDLDDKLIEGIFEKSKGLLRDKGKIYVTSCDQAMKRVEKIAKKYNIELSKVYEQDLHQDGNVHYILEIEQNIN